MLTIQKSKKYDDFSLIEGNRAINPFHVQALKKSMDENPELMPALPIVVNDDLEILDGQHRFQAVKELGGHVYYVVIKGATIKQIQKMNTTAKPWKMMDYAESYAKSGNEEYIKFLEIYEKYSEFSINSISPFLEGKVENSHGIKNFKTGKFKLREDLEKGLDAIEKLRGLKKYCESYYDRNVCRVFYQLMNSDTFDYDRLMERAEHGGHLLKGLKGQLHRDCLRIFEEVYNFNMKSEANKARLF